MSRAVQVGDRIRLVSMADDPDPVEPGSEGTVDYVGPDLNGWRQIGVAWDDGRSLMLCTDTDRFVVTGRVAP